jgi:hypothetical protein
MCLRGINPPLARIWRSRARLAARQHGVVSVDDLRRCGLSNKAISVRVANGRLHPLHRASYAGRPREPDA